VYFLKEQMGYVYVIVIGWMGFPGSRFSGGKVHEWIREMPYL
jgi:hypothetical protein